MSVCVKGGCSAVISSSVLSLVAGGEFGFTAGILWWSGFKDTASGSFDVDM